MKKGQLTIEYLLILVILIMLFTSISTDLMDFASTNTLQIQTEQAINIHNTTLHNTVNIVALQAEGAKQTITLNTPPDCEYLVSDSSITLQCIAGTPSQEYTGTTIGNIAPGTGVTYSGENIPASKTGKVTVER